MVVASLLPTSRPDTHSGDLTPRCTRSWGACMINIMESPFAPMVDHTSVPTDCLQLFVQNTEVITVRDLNAFINA